MQQVTDWPRAVGALCASPSPRPSKLWYLQSQRSQKNNVISAEPEEYDMANRQQRSNREKKKPKADKNKTKSTAPASPFALARRRTPPASGHTAKRTA
jgi:hypothetical protein